MDRLQAMRVFARVAELGSFTRAAQALALSRTRVSEALAELERELGARLLHRTTRRVALSDDGRAYYERVRQILVDVAEAEALIGGSPALARGRLRVAMPIALGRLHVVPALPRLLSRHPELAVEVRLENRVVDLLEEGLDCALSYGKPSQQDLVARQLAETHLLTCASPAYLREHGAPSTPEALTRHNCIAFLALAGARPTPWSFERRGEPLTHAPSGNLGFNSMEACVEAAAAGLGITQVLSSVGQRALRARRLRAVLPDCAAAGPGIYAVYPPHRHLSPRLRALLDFFGEVFARRRSRPTTLP